uniref:Uncharacterized protein n=1 Tax=uncultured Methanosarcinales archaeon TaxID=183757 RepID=A0A7H1KNE1_9EURY|nr:hypothetical protein EKMJPAOO_00005 [uncultured Methanosarcinales archaeon]
MNKQPGGKLPVRSRKMEPRPGHNHGGSDRMLQDASAVSIVIAVVMIFGLLITIAAYINVYYIPSWAEDAEAKHARNAFTDFSSIPGAINGLVIANATNIVSRQRIELGGGDIPVISPVRSWGSLGVVPREGNFTVTADAWVVNITENPPNNGTITDAGVNITNISDISLFYIDIESATGTFLGGGGELFINFTNQSGWVQSGGVRIWSESGTYSLKISTWDDDNNRIIDSIYINRATDQSGSGPGYYRIDLLNPCYGFSKVLSNADTPYNLTIEANRSAACNYTIIYNEYNKSLVRYSATSNGTLIYESMNRYFLDQKFIYQNGAVFLCQAPNASMRALPAITIANTTDESARITIPMITVGTGINRTPIISGSGVEELRMTLGHQNRVPFAEGNNTDNVHITIEPPEGDENFRKDYLQEWANYFDATVEGTSVRLRSGKEANWTNITITLNGSIHLDIQDIYIDGRTSRISS